MKFKYIKPRKLSYNGNQYLQGDILEFERFDEKLPRDWFEEIKEEPKEKQETKTITKKGVGK